MTQLMVATYTLGAFPTPLARLHRIERALDLGPLYVKRDDLSGFWVHVDADVLDDAIMPAVDYRMPGGLSLAELETALRAAFLSGRMVGLELTILNPALDPEDRGAHALAQTVLSALSSP